MDHVRPNIKINNNQSGVEVIDMRWICVIFVWSVMVYVPAIQPTHAHLRRRHLAANLLFANNALWLLPHMVRTLACDNGRGLIDLLRSHHFCLYFLKTRYTHKCHLTRPGSLHDKSRLGRLAAHRTGTLQLVTLLWIDVDSGV